MGVSRGPPPPPPPMVRRLLAIGALGAFVGSATARAPPHASGLARAALSHAGFAWRTEGTEGIHLPYLPCTFAAAHAPELARDAAAAPRYDLSLARMARP